MVSRVGLLESRLAAFEASVRGATCKLHPGQPCSRRIESRGRKSGKSIIIKKGRMKAGSTPTHCCEFINRDQDVTEVRVEHAEANGSMGETALSGRRRESRESVADFYGHINAPVINKSAESIRTVIVILQIDPVPAASLAGIRRPCAISARRKSEYRRPAR